MDKVESKLLELREALEKAMKLPSIKGPKIPTAPETAAAPAIPKQPDLVPASKKNPVKVAQQIENPDIKAKALDMAKEKLKLAKNGQWSLEEEPIEKGIKQTLAGAALAAGMMVGGAGQAQAEMKVNKPISQHYFKDAMADKDVSSAMTDLHAAGGHMFTVSHDSDTGRMQLNIHGKGGNTMGVVSDDGEYHFPAQKMSSASADALKTHVGTLSQHFKNYVSKIRSGGFGKPAPAK